MTKPLDRVVGATAFGRDVAGYAAGRLDYPAELFDLLEARCGPMASARVLEIGPGTGQATRRLLDLGARVTAIEPDPALAGHLRAWGDPGLEVQCVGFGPAVEGSAGFDLVIAATSFHWLDSAPALAEVRRILKPGGHFAMWWNIFREEGDDVLFDTLFEGISRPPSLAAGPHYSLDTAARCAELAAAGLVDVRHVCLERTVELTPAGLRALFATFSAIRALAPELRHARLEAAERMALSRHGGRFGRSVRTPLYLASTGSEN